MTQPDDSELLPLRYRPQPESARFWLCLGLGSIAVHAIALYILGQTTGGTGPGGQRDQRDRSMPVELIGPRVPASPAPAVDRPLSVNSGSRPSPGTSAMPAPARPVTPASSALPNFRPLSPEQLGQRIDQQNRNPITPPQPLPPVTDPSLIQPPWPGQTLPPVEPSDRPNPDGQPPTNPADRPTSPSQPPTPAPNPNNPGNPQASGEGPATPDRSPGGSESGQPGQSGQGITLVINSMDLAQGNTDRLASGDLARQPQPHQTQASNLGLAYTPALAAIFGQAIELSLAVGPDGSVLPGSVRILTPGLTPAASNAAKDLALRLTFEPGLDRQGQPIAVNLRAIVVLQKINP